MANLTNVGKPMVANRGFVALAVEAGIVPVIESIVGLAMDKQTLLVDLVNALEDDNPPLAAGLNYQTLDAILLYMEDLDGSGVINANNLPRLLNEDGPVSVTAGWDGGDAGSEQINVTYSEPPPGYTAEIYLDGLYAKHSAETPAGGFCSDSISGIQIAISTVRVLYRSADGNHSRFGPIANL